jgi:hypothetical protein
MKPAGVLKLEVLTAVNVGAPISGDMMLCALFVYLGLLYGLFYDAVSRTMYIVKLQDG